jgi:hypothetical protein
MSAVPAKWSSLYVCRDDPEDPAPAFSCIVTAGVLLGQLVPDEQVALRLLDRLPVAIDFDGDHDRQVRAIAKAAGLSTYRPHFRPMEPEPKLPWDEDPPDDENVWIVRYMARFTSPKGTGRRSFEAVHFGLVLAVQRGGLVIADPHPWRPQVSVVKTTKLVEAWRAAAGRGKPWALCLGAFR